MSVNTINQLSTSNTFQQWLNATELLIATANLITNGSGETFYANTRLEIGGTGSSLNVVTAATIEQQTSNVINVDVLTANNVTINENVVQVNVTTDASIANTLSVSRNSFLFGNVALTANITFNASGKTSPTFSGNTVVFTSGANSNYINVSTLNVTSLTSNTSNFTGLSYFSGSAKFDRITSSNVTLTNITSLNAVTSNFTGLSTFSGDALFDTIISANLTVANAETLTTNTCTIDGVTTFNSSFVQDFATPAITSGNLTLDLSSTSNFVVTLNADINNIILTNYPSVSKFVSFVLIFVNDGSERVVTWPASFRFPSAIDPELSVTNDKRDVLVFFTYDGGVNWQGFEAGLNL